MSDLSLDQWLLRPVCPQLRVNMEVFIYFYNWSSWIDEMAECPCSSRSKDPQYMFSLSNKKNINTF